MSPTNLPAAGVPSQSPSSRPLPPDTQSLPPFYPPGLPYLYGQPGPHGGQYRSTGPGMNIPQPYYGTPPHPPFNQYGNAGPWGYDRYPPGAIPNTLLHPGDLQPTGIAPSNAAVQTNEGGHLTTNLAAPTEFRPRRTYPNTQVSEGGTSDSIK